MRSAPVASKSLEHEVHHITLPMERWRFVSEDDELHLAKREIGINKERVTKSAAQAAKAGAEMNLGARNIQVWNDAPVHKQSIRKGGRLSRRASSVRFAPA
jgi:hypothetical protein